MVTGAAGKVDGKWDLPATGGIRAIGFRIGRAEEGNGVAVEGGCDMHRTAFIPDNHIACFHEIRELMDVGFAGEV